MVFVREFKKKYLNALSDLKTFKKSWVNWSPLLRSKLINTNGKGVLQIPEPVMNDLVAPALKNMSVHSLRFDHDFTYTNPYNSTDVSGYKTVFTTMTQFFNIITV